MSVQQHIQELLESIRSYAPERINLYLQKVQNLELHQAEAFHEFLEIQVTTFLHDMHEVVKVENEAKKELDRIKLLVQDFDTEIRSLSHREDEQEAEDMLHII